MLKKIGQRLKNERGLTLIELLAVVVILGIIAAIAIPSIGGLINNSKKDAHIANAEQMVSAARLAITADEVTFDTNNKGEISLGDLVKDGYLEAVENPSGGDYNEKSSKVTITKGENGNYSYEVLLRSSKKHLEGDPSTIKRTSVKL